MAEPKTYQPDGAMVNRINRDFTYQAPKEDQIPRFGMIRDKAKEFALLLVTVTPSSREQAMALTNLEQVVAHANAAIARNE